MFVKASTSVRFSLDTSTPLDGRSDVAAAAPGMFAARIPKVHLTDDDVVVFSYLVRQSSKLDLNGSALSSPTIPAEALDLFVFQDISDGWYGLSWARRLGPLGIGVSAFYSAVDYRQRLETKDMRIDSPGSAGSLSENLYYALSCNRLIGKAGATWARGPVALGATVTPPSLRLPGSSGTMSANRHWVYADTSLSAEIATTRQENLDADYREPWSVALGVRLETGRFELQASAEQFGAVDRYDVLKVGGIASQVPPQTYPLFITQRRESVFNFGAGASVKANSWLSCFASARTDHSYRPAGEPTFVGLGAYDLIHLTGGVGLSGSSFQVYLGAIYATGDAAMPITLSPLPAAPTVTARTEFEQSGFVLAFNASF